MDHCNGKCHSCSGCGKELLLSAPELTVLQTLAQIPFLPVARKADDMTPIYLEDTLHTREEYALALQLLEKKSLISLDYDRPLTGMDMSAYAGYPVHGSFALTARGQAVIDLLDRQGIHTD